jgi:30S ribosomal protein S31
MGKGDKRTKRGKIFKGSYGKTRPHREGAKKPAPAPAGKARRG